MIIDIKKLRLPRKPSKDLSEIITIDFNVNYYAILKNV